MRSRCEFDFCRQTMRRLRPTDWMSSPDTAQSGRVLNELMQMIKLDIAKLQAAYEGK